MKLPEAVEWLERNYDAYRINEFPALESHGIEFSTVWFPGPGLDYNSVRYELGVGPGHSQPMFTLKDLGNKSYADSYQWYETQFVPLSRESEKAGPCATCRSTVRVAHEPRS